MPLLLSHTSDVKELFSITSIVHTALYAKPCMRKSLTPYVDPNDGTRRLGGGSNAFCIVHAREQGLGRSAFSSMRGHV